MMNQFNMLEPRARVFTSDSTQTLCMTKIKINIDNTIKGVLSIIHVIPYMEAFDFSASKHLPYKV